MATPPRPRRRILSRGRLLAPFAIPLLATPAHAQHRDNYSASFDRALTLAPAAHAPRAPRLTPAAKPSLPVFPAAIDARRGVPSFAWAARGAFAPPRTGAPPAEAARAHLGKLASLYDLPPAALASAVVREVHDTGRGGVLVTFGQEIDGIPVFQEKAKLLLRRGTLELVAASGHLSGAATPHHRAQASLFSLSMEQAVVSALDDLHGLRASPGRLLEVARGEGGYRRFDLPPGGALRFDRPARVKQVFYPLPGHLVPGYYVEVFTHPVAPRDTALVYGYVISAADGRVLHRVDLTSHATFQYRVWADTTGNHRPADGPTADYTPHPTGQPDGSYPPFVAPVLISMDGFNTNPNAQPDPWLGAGATETRGNNVDAYTDDDNPDGFSSGDLRATISSPGVFDWTYDTSLSPTADDTQRKASVTQLFYTVNWLHDEWYDSGFDEAAGNAQQNNYGRGGLGGDRIVAQAQDGAALGNIDNANMYTPADGESPQMQMYLWSGRETRQLSVNPVAPSVPTNSAEFGPKSFHVGGDVILVNDGNGNPADACSTIQNDLTGKIALIDRGTCSFQVKVQRAEAKGAIGVLIANQQPGGAPYLPGDGSADPTIPALSVSQSDGNAIKAALAAGPVTATLVRDTQPPVDGTIDNMVVAHEWGHYLHRRLVDWESNQTDGEGEGWGDFIALMMAVRETDDLGGSFADCVYAPVAGEDAGYFGTRRFPYTVDFTKNAMTFKHIADGEPLPTGMPMQDADAPNSETHNTGEVWGLMMFEAYVALLRESQGPTPRYTFDEARRRMTDYVVAGMKLAPSDPTFTEQRDAILAAAHAADAADALVLAQAFARRGAGSCAVSPPKDSFDNTGVVESFSVAPAMSIVSVVLEEDTKSCDSDGILDAEEQGHVFVEVMNGNIAPLMGTEVTVTATGNGITFPQGTKATIAAIDPLGTAKVSFAVQVDPALLGPEPFIVTAEAQNPAACNPKVSGVGAFRVNYDNAVLASASDGFESDISVWTIDGADGGVAWSKTVDELANHAWHGLDLGYTSDTRLVSPGFHVSATEPLTVSFRHRHGFEASPDGGGPDVYWDGGVVELSTDAGATWKDVETFGAKPGYGGKINGDASNPLGDRSGFVSQNAIWPAMETVTLDFGTALAGKTAMLRFRIGTDDAVHDFGWEIDDVAITGTDDTPFPAVVNDAATCNHPPVADAGVDRAVKSGELVKLDGSKSSDPDGDAITFAWTQTSGPAVKLSAETTAAPQLTAPALDARVTLGFQVTVSDGVASASDTVNIDVEPAETPAPPDQKPSPTPRVEAEGGCACEAAPSSDGRALAPLVAAALLAMRRRRRR